MNNDSQGYQNELIYSLKNHARTSLSSVNCKLLCWCKTKFLFKREFPLICMELPVFSKYE